MIRIRGVVWLTAGGVLMSVLVAALTWRSLAPATVPDKIGLLTFFVLIATGAVITWYSWETRQLRWATHRQTSLQIRPFLSIEYLEDRRMWIHNPGKGVARNVVVKDIRLTGEPDAPDATSYLSVEWQPIDFIRDGDRRELIGEGVLLTREQKMKMTGVLKGWHADTVHVEDDGADHAPSGLPVVASPDGDS